MTCLSHLSPLISHVSFLTSHFSPLISHLSFLTSHFSFHTSHLSFLTSLTSHFSFLISHVSPLTSHFSFLTSHLSFLISHLSPLTSHLSPHFFWNCFMFFCYHMYFRISCKKNQKKNSKKCRCWGLNHRPDNLFIGILDPPLRSLFMV